MHMRKLMLVAVGVVAACAPAAAQTAPAAPAASPGVVRVIRVPNAMHAQGAAFSLNGAYREIGRAEQAGATGHLVEAARTHYRGAMARYGKNDGAGAAREARHGRRRRTGDARDAQDAHGGRWSGDDDADDPHRWVRRFRA